ncbi:MAG: carbon dioxide concentrating mechanism protein [Thermosynechococcaceae cyanobacterium]
MEMPQSMNQVQVSGDVTLDESVAIATNVLLIADPGSQLVIAAGVSIGTGSIIHAHHGILAIDEGATLASEVLVVGKGKIGSRSNIGPKTTIFNGNVEPGQVIPAGSLLGEQGRQSTSSDNVRGDTTVAPSEEPDRFNEPAPSNGLVSGYSTTSLAQTSVVFGRDHIERLLNKLLPHRPGS